MFTEAERRYCFSRPNPAQHFAARFAGKEAVGKALGCGVEFMWRDIEIAGRPKPAVSLSGWVAAFADRAGAGAIDLSMTHSKRHGGRRRGACSRGERPAAAVRRRRDARRSMRRAIEGLGIPGAVLMERAGLAAAHELLQRHPAGAAGGGRVRAGNNGGDGFVVARHLQARRAGRSTRAGRPGRAGSASTPAGQPGGRRSGWASRSIATPPPARLRAALRRADVVVDALFGTASTGAPRGAAAAAVDAI